MGPNSELAERFFGAAAAGDTDSVRGMCDDPGFQLSQNGGPAMGVDGLVAIVSAVGAAIPDFRYENAVRSDTLAGFVEEHDVRGTLPDGTVFHLAACVVASVKGGKIVAGHEYFDTAAAAGLAKALRG